jgi:heme oxygenase
MRHVKDLCEVRLRQANESAHRVVDSKHNAGRDVGSRHAYVDHLLPFRVTNKVYEELTLIGG